MASLGPMLVYHTSKFSKSKSLEFSVATNVAWAS